MSRITDEYMRQKIAQTKEYCIVIPNRHREDVEKIIWEHGRWNFALREEGVLPIVCPVEDASEVIGIGIFNAGIDKVRAVMDEDPGVRGGVFVYEIHQCRSFPGDCLPG